MITGSVGANPVGQVPDRCGEYGYGIGTSLVANLDVELGGLLIGGFVSGCGSGNTPAGTAVSDDQLIRATLIQEVGAASAWDFEAVAEITCEKFREHARAQANRLIPPMSTFDDIEPAVLGPDMLSAILKDKIPGSTAEQTIAVARALISKDQAAYTQAMKALIQQTSSMTLTNVDNIKVTGDTAPTADATNTSALAGEQPRTDTRSIQLVREGGRWKDCTTTYQPIETDLYRDSCPRLCDWVDRHPRRRPPRRAAPHTRNTKNVPVTRNVPVPTWLVRRVTS